MVRKVALPTAYKEATKVPVEVSAGIEFTDVYAQVRRTAPCERQQRPGLVKFGQHKVRSVENVVWAHDDYWSGDSISRGRRTISYGIAEVEQRILDFNIY